MRPFFFRDAEAAYDAFFKGARTRLAPMRYGERLFDFHNESAWPACETFRDLVNRWISDFGLSDQTQLISQMKAQNSQFQHTLLELVVSSILRALGFSVELHPNVAASAKNPDFLISDGCRRGYVEVTSINPPDASRRAANREAVIARAIDALELPPGVALSYHASKIGRDSISAERLARAIKTWADTEKSNAQEQVSRVFRAADWEIEIGLIRTGSNRIYDRAIAVRPGCATWIQTAADLRSAMDQKQHRYGKLDAPFVLVVGDSKGLIWGRQRISEELIAALFGREMLHWSPDSGPRWERAKDGFWQGPNGRRNPHVSGVLFFPNMGLFGLRNELHLPQLAINPWATHPIPPSLARLPRIELENEKLVFNAGVCVADLLGLPSDWPGPSGA